MPKVSVLMPVYNAQPYLRSALNSILRQTLTDFEFIIVNDGSTDASDTIIRSFQDGRIRYEAQSNRGLVATLNRLVANATGEYLARMDPDDWSHPERLARQASFLDRHPDVGLVGSWVEVMDQAGRHRAETKYPITDRGIREMLLIDTMFAHGAVMLRRSLQVHYRADRAHAEDYDLWTRLLLATEAANLPLVLYRWRLNPAGASLRNRTLQRKTAHAIRLRYITGYLANQRTSDGKEDAIEFAYRGRWRTMLGKIRIVILLLSLRQWKAAGQLARSSWKILFLHKRLQTEITSRHIFMPSDWSGLRR